MHSIYTPSYWRTYMSTPQVLFSEMGESSWAEHMTPKLTNSQVTKVFLRGWLLYRAFFEMVQLFKL